jgi:hypothetical protein
MWTDTTRPKYERRNQRYASDLTDAEFALIGPYLPVAKPVGRPRTTDPRVKPEDQPVGENHAKRRAAGL